VIASDVSSRTADVGDKISLTLAEDLKAGDAVVVKKERPPLQPSPKLMARQWRHAG